MLCALSRYCHPSFMVESVKEVREFKNAMREKWDALEDLCCVPDGLKLQV